MAREQHTTGWFPIPTSHFAAGHPIQRGASSSVAALRALLLNDNTEWAQRSPPLLCAPTPISKTTEYFYTPASTGGSSSDIYLAWRGVWGQDSRLDLRWNVLAKASDGTTAGTIRLRAEDAGNNLDLTVSTGTTSWTWHTGTVTVNGSDDTSPIVAEYDTVTLRAWRTAGSGSLYVRGYSCWLEPHSGNLPSGIQDSGQIAHDLDEVLADQHLCHMMIRRLKGNIDSYLGGYGWGRPVVGTCVPMLNNGAELKGAYTFLANIEDVWRPVGAAIPYPRQHNKNSLRYNIFGARDGTSAKVRIRNLSLGTGDATEHTLATSPTVTTQSDWHTGTLEVRPRTQSTHPAEVSYDWIQLEVVSDGSDYGWVWSVALQEEEPS